MAGKTISPKQLAAQWRTLPNRFEVNVLNFEVLAGRAAVAVFRESFYLQRFNTSGAASWPARKDYRRHPLLRETNSLARSIVSTRFSMNRTRGVMIYTSHFSFANSRRNKTGMCYAAIHNEGGKIAAPGSNASYIQQRQFMGHSSVLDSKLEEISIRIFDGFPKCL